MTKRHFYTDPLAAAWMAKHFGMVFDRWTEGLGEWTGRLSGSDSLQDFEGCTQLFIYPDSLHLLEPREGDLVDVTKWRGQRGRHYPYRLVERTYRSGGVGFISCLGSSYEIGNVSRVIQRDGKPFMWPEVEA